jgi:uncharacterized protein YjbI with pentapeptide repeats
VANQKHVEILKRDVAEWNAWNKSEPIIPDLTAADLTRAILKNANLAAARLTDADLTDADLTHAILTDANLQRANLANANLKGAHLDYADLTGADLTRAILTDANLAVAILTGANLAGAKLTPAILTNANLIGANLAGADLHRSNLASARLTHAILTNASLYGANLKGATLSGADLTNAAVGDTIFANVDLTGVVGFETCRHSGPSSIDHQTLEQSVQLPIPFLRGVGLPDHLIEYLPALFNQAIQHYSCFISYSAKDDDFAKRIHADLQNKGVRCWFAPHDMPIGAKLLDAIDEAIRLRDKLLLILSKNSIDSDWVEDEVTKAFAEERDRKQPVLFPLRIDDTVMEAREPWARKLRDQRNIGDFRRWKDHDAYKASLDRVLRDLTKPGVEGG